MFGPRTRPSLGEVARRQNELRDEMRRGFADMQVILSSKVVMTDLYTSEQRDQDNRLNDVVGRIERRQGQLWALAVAVSGSVLASVGSLITAIVLAPKH